MDAQMNRPAGQKRGEQGKQDEWDVVVVGTGMGGATLGYAAAKAGLRVLFIEKGRSHLSEAPALRGKFAESFFPRPESPEPKHREILARAGRCWEEIEDVSKRRIRRYVPFIGCGTGGSSSLYGMALERLYPKDFTPKDNYPNVPDADLPKSWPISYEQLRPYYEAAERLFRVRGGGDSLRDEENHGRRSETPELNPGNKELFDFVQGKGMHPYRLPLACDYEKGTDKCQSFLDAGKSKNDAARICLEPALNKYGASLLSECEVLRVEATKGQATGVVCLQHGKRFNIRGKTIVLAAGALISPSILLNSASSVHPQGLANRSGLVGRNLMRHYVDLLVFTPKNKGPFPDCNTKQFAFNDLYFTNGQKFGTVQSFGDMPPAPVVAAGLEKDLRDGPGPWAAALFRTIKPLATSMFARMFSRGVVLASIMEDLPFADNCVAPIPTKDGRFKISVRYQVRKSEAERIAAFRKCLSALFKQCRCLVIKQAENNERIAHACGTCRFGDDPRRSVLDADNRAHDISNLYVVDASFFPSSGGTNPGLTIAANALRVGERLVAEFRNEKARPAAEREPRTQELVVA